MTRIVLRMVLAAGLGLVATADRAAAQGAIQPGNPATRPAVSPYINLTRPGNAGVNYYGLVKPQFDVNRQIQGLQQQQQGVLQQLGTAATEDEGYANSYAITGHSSVFFNYSHYFGQAGGNVRPAQPPPGVIRRY